MSTTVKFFLAILTIAFTTGTNFAQQKQASEKPAPPGMVRTVRAEKKQLVAVTHHQYGVMVSTVIIDDKGRLLEVADYLPGGSPDVKSTRAYDEKGNEIESAFYIHDDLSSRTFSRYDSRNRKIEHLSLFGDGKQRSKSVYKYDKAGRRIAFEVESNGKLVKRAEATLDRRGNELERIEYSDKGVREGRYVFRYDSAGNQLSETHYYNKDGKPGSSRTTYVYDRDGEVIEYSRYSDGVLEEKQNYKRDARGNPIEVIETDDKHSVVKKQLWSYEFNADGDPVRATISEWTAKAPHVPLQPTFEVRRIYGSVKIATFALWGAASEGDTARVAALLEQGADVNAHHPDGATPLIRAARGDHREVVQKLLGAGATIDDQDAEGWTALMWSAEFGKLETVDILLKAGANPNARNVSGAVAIMAATLNGHIDVMKLLLDKGADINAGTNEGATALMLAAAAGKVEVLKFLIERGANIHAKTSDGETALSIAVAEKKDAAAELLRKAGAK